jgi:hypothetical protein
MLAPGHCSPSLNVVSKILIDLTVPPKQNTETPLISVKFPGLTDPQKRFFGFFLLVPWASAFLGDGLADKVRLTVFQ